MRLHYIVVSHGISAHVARHFKGSSGSLVFNSDLREPEHYTNPDQCRPFQIGWLDQDKPFVHVLDDTSLNILLETLDTVTDLIEYLRAKESLLSSYNSNGVRFVYCGEEELLAKYLLTTANNKYGFDFPPRRCDWPRERCLA